MQKGILGKKKLNGDAGALSLAVVRRYARMLGGAGRLTVTEDLSLTILRVLLTLLLRIYAWTENELSPRELGMLANKATKIGMQIRQTLRMLRTADRRPLPDVHQVLAIARRNSRRKGRAEARAGNPEVEKV
jgi:hypothetical protein